jgi:hypothetical protein
VGEETSEREKVEILLDLMKGLTGEDRKVQWNLGLALSKSGKVLWSEECTCASGYILSHIPEGEIPSSYWIGHVWYYPDLGKTHNNLTEEERAQKGVNVEMKESFQKFLRQIK